MFLKDSERFGYINITIVDNDVPEDEKWFIVSLLNPSGGAAIGTGSTVKVIIDHSDGAFGVFQFTQNSSQGVQALETEAVGFTVTNLQV